MLSDNSQVASVSPHIKSVFVIEDNEVVGEFIQTSLLHAGIENVVLFTDPAKAVAALRSSNVGLIITDLYMPRVNGFTLTQFFNDKHELRSIPVLVVSADQSPATRDRLARAGVTAILPKPLDSQQLVSAVRNSLNARIDSGSRKGVSPNRRAFSGRNSAGVSTAQTESAFSQNDSSCF